MLLPTSNQLLKDHYQNSLVIKLNQIILQKLNKDKLVDYLKLNSYYIKQLNRNPSFYETFKKEIKEKYNLRLTDKVNNIINDIELVSTIIGTIN